MNSFFLKPRILCDTRLVGSLEKAHNSGAVSFLSSPSFFGNFSPYPTKSNLRLLSFFVVLLKSSLVFCGSSKMISFHMTITQAAKLEMDLGLRRPRAENRMEDGCYQVSYM